MAYVRIHPFDPRRGFKVKRYIVLGVRFEADKGWYEVPDDYIPELKSCVQDVSAPVPVPVFQVATKEEAMETARKEYEEQNPERKIEEAVKGAQSVDEETFDDTQQEKSKAKKKVAEKKAKKAAKKGKPAPKKGAGTDDDLKDFS